MSSAKKPVPSADQAEELLAALEGVVSAHVVADAGGRIVEIHVLASSQLHPKQVVRNVESALSAGLGIGIDRRVVSVAQIRSTEPGMEEAEEAAAGGAAGEDGESRDNGRGPVLSGRGEPVRRVEESGGPRVSEAEAVRLEYVRYESRRTTGGCICEVLLRDSAVEIRGRGMGPDTSAGRAEAASRAVIDAIVGARSALRLALEGAVLLSSRGREYVIVAAHVVEDRTTIPLCGAARVSRSPEEAAILAALQATNRWSG